MKALGFALLWVAGMFVPAGARTFVQLPDWLALSWMFGWAIGGYILAPYGMWKQQRAAALKPTRDLIKRDPRAEGKP
jgi:hypothetical protein